MGQRLQDPLDSTRGLIPRGTIVSNAAGDVRYSVREDTTFPLNVKSVHVGATSLSTGSAGNIGPNLLTSHTLSNSDVLVTNDIAISTGADDENDDDYRFRLSRAFSTRFSNNSAAIQVAATSIDGVSRAEIVPFSRGAGTFDILLIPRGNKLPRSVADEAARAIDRVTAYGISARVKEPEYVAVKLTIRLRYAKETEEGLKDAIRDQVQSSVLSYLGNIPLNGELVINQIRATVLGVSPNIIDLSILELCVDGRPQAIRNQKLAPDELFVPDTDREAVIII
jgi:uncharacterized phage protein gp47/JayE